MSKEQVFRRINANLPKHLRENVTKTEVDTSEEDMAKRLLQDPRVTKAEKRLIEKKIESGELRSSEEVVNDKVTKEIDRYHEKKIKDAIARGDLPDPATDPFVQKRQRHLEELRRQGKIK